MLARLKALTSSQKALVAGGAVVAVLMVSRYHDLQQRRLV